MIEFTINSKINKMENATAIGNTLMEAIGTIMHLNGHADLLDTDWDIYNESGDYLVVQDGVKV